MTSKAIGAIKTQNEKGEQTVEPVKIVRYFPGKAPESAKKIRNEEEDKKDKADRRRDRDRDRNRDKEKEKEKDKKDKGKAVEDDDDDDIGARIAKLRQGQIQSQLQSQKVKDSLAQENSAMESIDRRLRRLKESRDSDPHEGRSRHREIYEGEIVSKARPEREREEDEEEKKDEGKGKGEQEEEDDDEEIDRRRARLREMAKKQREQEQEQLPQGEEEEQEEEESSEYETDSEESEDEFAVKMLAKPVFIPKSERKTIEERERLLKEEEEIQRKNEEKKMLKKEETQLLVAEEVRKAVEGPPKDEKIHDVNDIDDTDGINELEEYEKWKLRELLRIRRDREEREKIKQEKEEIERRRNMTDKEIMEENKKIPEKVGEQKQKYKFLQKYYHKGAYYQEDEILKRDFNAPTLEDKFNRELLPKVLQVKDFGFAGRTKYTHLADQDTSKPDAGWNQKNSITQKMTRKMAGMNSSFDKPTAKKRKLD